MFTPMSNMKSFSKDQKLKELVRIARELGAAEAGIVSPNDIFVEDALADLCRKPRCPAFGLSAGCPPHVSGPAGFREMKKRMRHAIVIKIDVPASVLFSDQRIDIMRFLHETASEIERSAVGMGYSESRAFAGGSCKTLFCRDYAECRVISERGACRRPESARPSMSGFGINVSKLLQAAGFNGEFQTEAAYDDEESMSWVAGLIALA